MELLTKITYLCFGSNIIIGSILAQELPVVIPPSPTAATLGQYGEVPVNNYTGVPSISIPLYEVNSGDISVPITLSYNSSGIKVSQEASSVGLGWSLNAGGVITRSIRGRDDLQSQGYIFTSELASTSSDTPLNFSQGHPDYQTYISIHDGLTDGEPDVLYYNFLGLAGKMIFDKKPAGNTIVKGIPLEQTNIKFTYDTANDEWIVTDGNGWKYYFNIHEKTINYNASELYLENYNSGTFLYNVDRIDDHPNVLPSPGEITSWYLHRIVTHKGDEVIFEYDNGINYKSVGQMIYSEQESMYGNPLIEMDENLWRGFFTEQKFRVSAVMQSFDNVNLKKIIFPNGYIDFSTSPREDMRQFGSYSKSRKIDFFEVFNNAGTSIKKVNFTYSYFNESITGPNKENYWRLKLDQVQESFYNATNQTYTSIPPYRLSYNTTALPSKTSASIDYWGYYNGVNNENIKNYVDLTSNLYDVNGNYNFTTNPIIVNDNTQTETSVYKSLRPIQLVCSGSSRTTVYPFTSGAYREPDTVKMQAAILKRIDNPMGGSTNYTYSANRYNPPTDIDFYRYERQYRNVFHEGLGVADEKAFTLNYHTIVNIDCSIYDYGSTNEIRSVDAFILTASGDPVISFKPENLTTFKKQIKLILPPGDYKLKAKTNAGASIVEIYMAIEFFQRFWTSNKIGGGLRIEKIQILDEMDNVALTKKYKYTNGRAMSDIQHVYRDIGFGTDEFLLLSNVVGAESVIVRSSNSTTPLSSSAQGNFVGYNLVTIYDEDAIGNKLGRSEYLYTNIPDVSGQGIFKLPGFPMSIHLNNGNLLENHIYNSNGDLLKKSETIYNEGESSTIMVKGIYTRMPLKEPPQNSSWKPMVRFYRIYAEWWHPEQTIETTYSSTGNYTLETNYYYDNSSHKNLTLIEKGESNNSVTKTKYLYPHDLVSVEQSLLLQELIDINNISQPIVTETFLDNVKTTETHVAYDKSSLTGNIILPAEVHAKTGITDINITTTNDLKIKYYQYDEKGKPLEIGKANDIHTSFIWGYNNTYPVAKLINVAYNSIPTSTINTIQNLSNLDYDHCYAGESCAEENLRAGLNSLRAQFPDASITVYTYDPLVGMTSQTDPNGQTIYFSYDDLGRLQSITDFEGNHLSKTDYHYSGQ
ncbi:MAG: RHS repeat domain-containing protein [Cyclobacteriaceae bacterium]